MSGPMLGDKGYQAECDMRTLAEAVRIQRDPKRLKAAREMAKKKVDELTSVAQTEKEPEE